MMITEKNFASATEKDILRGASGREHVVVRVMTGWHRVVVVNLEGEDGVLYWEGGIRDENLTLVDDLNHEDATFVAGEYHQR